MLCWLAGPLINWKQLLRKLVRTRLMYFGILKLIRVIFRSFLWIHWSQNNSCRFYRIIRLLSTWKRTEQVRDWYPGQQCRNDCGVCHSFPLHWKRETYSRCHQLQLYVSRSIELYCHSWYDSAQERNYYQCRVDGINSIRFHDSYLRSV